MRLWLEGPDVAGMDCATNEQGPRPSPIILDLVQQLHMTSSGTLIDPLAKRLQAAQALIEAGKLTEAALKLNAARAAAPGDARVYLIGMLLAEKAGNPQGAQQSARRALELAPEWSVGVTEVALLLARQNQFDEAIALARRAVELDGQNPAVLGRVIDIAHRAKLLDLAIEWLERAVALVPDHLHIQYLLARDLAHRGEHERALAGLESLLQAKPEDPVLLIARLKSRLALGQKELASQDGAALVAQAPDNVEFGFWLDLARGKMPSVYPESMVRSIYDGFAETFDQHMVAGLKYSLPSDVAAKIRALYPDNKLNVLDLGCGTGLLGASLGRIDGALVGVELSYKMIEQAGRRGVYDRFHNVDLVGALQATPDSLYHVIAALDVFIYVGDLTAAIPNAFRILRPGGQFIFSCETAKEEEEGNLVFLSTERFAHKSSYIEILCRSAGFDGVSLEAVTLRNENSKPVQGFLVVASKPV